MDDIKIIKKVDFVNPVMIAGWQGMGNFAIGVVEYLRRKLDASEIAEIVVDPMATLDAVMVEDGFAHFPPSPRNIFYYCKSPELIIFEGEAQLPGHNGIALLNKVLDAAFRFKVKRIYTGAAFPLPISHKEVPAVYGAANRKELTQEFSKHEVIPMEGGHISGLNGLILGFAQERNIEAICLLATMPQYAISLPNPKASSAIVETLQEMLGFQVNLHELEEYSKDMDEKMSLIEDRVKDVFTIDNEHPKPPAPSAHHKKIPGNIIEKIEKLFQEAKKDKSKAIILKKELDRWDLYKVYEDKFLDLFKENQ